MNRAKLALLVVFGLMSIVGWNLLAAEKEEKAPDVFQAKFETTVGDFVIEVHRDWSPTGADRFYNLVKSGFYDDCKFFRTIPGFMTQFGVNGDPKVHAKWDKATIKDDPVKKSNTRGFVTFAKTGLPNSRTSQIFINFGNNSRLDSDGFAPFGEVIEGMESVDKIYGGYGQLPRNAMESFDAQGNKYLNAKYPKLDAVKKATIVEKK